jgi:hypothetical protein
MRKIVHAVYIPPSLAARERSGEAADARFTKVVLNKVWKFQQTLWLVGNEKEELTAMKVPGK